MIIMSQNAIRQIFSYASSSQADSFSIESGADELSCFYHLPDGSRQSFRLPGSLSNSLAEDLRQLLDIAPGELAKDKYCKISQRGNSLAFRVSILPGTKGEKIIISIAKKEPLPLRLKQLGLNRRELSLVSSLKRGRGLALFASPDNQGKTTSLLAALNEINDPRLSLIIFGDPAEIKIDGANCLRFSQSAWRQALRSDCDVIAWDGISQDAELAEALLAAGNGRLVIGTIKGKNSLEVLARILKLPQPLSQKLQALRFIASQELADLKRAATKGGRKKIGLFELLEIDQTLKRFILEAATASDKSNFWNDCLDLATDNGFVPVARDRQIKAAAGLIKS